MEREIKGVCEYCKDLSEMEREYPDAPHHGAIIVCDECGAEYYEEYMGKISTINEQAQLNHPELTKF
jgi:hypothetical protein